MANKTLLELKKALEDERKALLRGAIEGVLKTASYKARLVEKIREEGLSREDRELLEEVLRLNERNKALIEAGLAFVEEAFDFLRNAMQPEPSYAPGLTGVKAEAASPRMISKEV